MVAFKSSTAFLNDSNIEFFVGGRGLYLSSMYLVDKCIRLLCTCYAVIARALYRGVLVDFFNQTILFRLFS